MAPTVPLLPCRPQHSSIPEDARRRSLSVIVGKLHLEVHCQGGGSLAVGAGAQELALGISRGLRGPRVGEKVPQVPSVGSGSQGASSSLFCAPGTCVCGRWRAARWS